MDKKEMAQGAAVISMATLLFVVDLPLGSVRAGFPQYSAEWFLTLGAALPFAGLVHWRLKLPQYNIIATLLAVTVGQIAGATLLPKTESANGAAFLLPSAKTQEAIAQAKAEAEAKVVAAQKQKKETE
mmetsp:Transcript_23617/g.59499  ORF Transcript_23617/g.59499 Transcript_23617/m.59499 type:complete len:128 (-) Transcript_23617:70-453(-)